MFKIGHFTKYLTAPGLLGPVSIKALLVKIQISPSQFHFALSVRDPLSGILMGSPDVEYPCPQCSVMRADYLYCEVIVILAACCGPRVTWLICHHVTNVSSGACVCCHHLIMATCPHAPPGLIVSRPPSSGRSLTSSCHRTRGHNLEIVARGKSILDTFLLQIKYSNI